MKKILIASAIFFTSLGFATAQQAPAKTTEKKAKMTTTVKKAHKKDMNTGDVAKTTGVKKHSTVDMKMKKHRMTAKANVSAQAKKTETKK